MAIPSFSLLWRFAMTIMVRAFPARASRAEIEAVAAELNGPRKQQATAFFRSYNLKLESWHLQETPAGLLVIVVTILDEEPQAATQRYAASTAEFDIWFKSQVLRLTGVDVNVDPMGPPTTRVYHWSDASDVQHLLM
jgi:hypothetical protein